jgi:hypothetical protein
MDLNNYFRGKKLLMTTREIYDARVHSLGWMLECFRDGTIRKRTIVNLIPEATLHSLLDNLEGDERYEDCKIIVDILKEVYDK